MPTDAPFRLTYHYAIPNSGAVHEGQTHTLTLPNEVLVAAPATFNLMDTDSNIIGTGVLNTNGTVTITFTDYPELYSNISGTFWFDLQFDEDEIGPDHPGSIVFQLGGTSTPITIPVDFDVPEPPTASVTKSGVYAYNSTTGNPEITWTIVANTESRTLHSAKIVDVVSDGLEFIPGSVTINGAPAPAANPGYDYTAATKNLTYNFPSPITTQQKITFKTTVSDSEFRDASQGITLHKTNTATLSHSGTSVISNLATVNVPVNFLAKTATYNTATKKIDWTITVNSNGIAIPNAVVTDVLPAGLTLTAGSVELDGAVFPATGPSFTYAHPNLSFNLGPIDERHVITYSTDVEHAAYESNTQKVYSNSAKLTGTNVPGNATRTRNIGVPTSVIRKTGVGYNKKTGEITWRVSVNENKISIQNAVITDLINPGQEYVPGSAAFIGTPPTPVNLFNYVAAAPGDTAMTGTLTYAFGGTITQTYTFEFKTKVTDPAVREGNASTTYRNEAALTGSNIPQSKSNGSQNVVSEVIEKTGTGYDYSTRNITWTVVVNSNETTLSNAIFTDNIPVGMEYVPGSATISGGLPLSGFGYVAATPSDTAKTGTLTYSFPATISEKYTITFQSHITDLTIFESNGDKTLSNKGSLTHSLVPGGIESEGTRVIRNVVVGKAGSYVNGNTFIDWEVNINSNEITVTNAILTDQLQEGLALDTSSVKLFEQTVNADGSLTLGSQVTLTGANVTYDLNTRLFTFTLPTPTSSAYKLLFRTDVTDKTKSPFTNQVTFDGTGTTGTSTSDQMVVVWAGFGNTGGGEVGSITVNKIDANNHATKLSGASFDLIDQYGNVIKQATTGAGGSVLFERLRFDINYTVKETVAPTGYVLNSAGYTFMIAGTDDQKNITYNYENTGIVGSIRFDKTDTNADPLGGAEFTLYNDALQSVATTLSASNGEVLFSNVPYGDYTIKETTPPAGYLPTEVVLTASITENGVTVTASPSSVSNQLILGNVLMKKSGDNGVTPLPDATFGLYKSDDTDFANQIAESTSDAEGTVFFKNVVYGSYVIRETASPEGYLVSTETTTVTVSEHEHTYDLGTFKNSLIRGGIEILKTNIRNEPLKGAKFGLYGAGDTLVAEAESGADGRVKFSNVPYGDYYVMETKAPFMYLINSKKVSIGIRKQDEVLRYTAVNQRDVKRYPWGLGGASTSAPGETGDSGPAMMLLLLVGSGLTLTGLLIARRKKISR